MDQVTLNCYQKGDNSCEKGVILIKKLYNKNLHLCISQTQLSLRMEG